MEQSEFFPQKQLKKDIDYVDLSTLEDFQSGSGGKKDWSFFDLEKDKYICYRTGYTNEHHKDLGPIFPGIQNKEKGKWIPCKIYESDINYPIFFIIVEGKTKKLLIHKIVAQCFLVNDQPELKKTVDHKNRDKSDWSLDNLVWASQKNNSKNKG